MIKVTKLSKKFGIDGGAVNAVNNVSMAIGKGEFVSIVGKSGSGKSTLLSLLGGLEKADSGSVVVDKTDITKLPDSSLVNYRCNTIGYVFQSFNLIPNLSALQNVMLPMEFAGVSKSDRKKRSKELLDKVGIGGAKQGRKPSRLSGGEQQRVAVARALANEPEFILADEPTGNLDSATGKKIFDLLHDLSRKEKTTIIVVTHDLSIAGKTDKTFKLQDGALVK